jgi:hypothetical protein
MEVTGTDVVAGSVVDVVVAATVVLVVGATVVLVEVVGDLWLLLLQAANTTTDRIARRRIRPPYVLCRGCQGSLIRHSAT